MSKLHANKTQEGSMPAASLHLLYTTPKEHMERQMVRMLRCITHTCQKFYIYVSAKIMHRYSVCARKDEAPCRDASSSRKQNGMGPSRIEGIKNSHSFKGLIIKEMKLNLYHRKWKLFIIKSWHGGKPPMTH